MRWRDDPLYPYVVVGLVLLLMVSSLLAYFLWREPSLRQIATPTLVMPTRSVATPRPTVTTMLISTVPASPPAPSATPRPSATPPQAVLLTFGVAEREWDCQWATELLTNYLRQHSALAWSMQTYDSADLLFQALANGEIDLTLCFVDPLDRPQISGDNKDRLGYIRQIGSYYWQEGAQRLQIWAHGAVKAELRTDHACAYRLLEKFTLLGSAEIGGDLTQWQANNTALIQTWEGCEE